MDNLRSRLLDMVAARRPRTDLKTASLACGRNHAYLHQFIHKGSPRRLPEDVRLRLAQHLGVDESLWRGEDVALPGATGRQVRGLAARAPTPLSGDGLATIAKIQLAAAAGGGTIVDEEPTNQAWHVPATWVASAFGASGRDLKMLEISGDSMEPVLYAGDQVLINVARRTPSPPGIFVVHDGFGLVAKQLELTPNSDPPEITLTSANRRYPPYRRHIDEITIIGRVVWFGRRL